MKLTTLKQSAAVAMAYRQGSGLRDNAVLFSNSDDDDIGEKLNGTDFLPTARLLYSIAGKVAVADWFGIPISADAATLQNDRELANAINPENAEELLNECIGLSRTIFKSDPVIRWAVLVLSEELSNSAILGTAQVEQILAPYNRFWGGQGPSPVGPLSISRTGRAQS